MNLNDFFELLVYLISICFLMFSLFIIAENFLIPNLENVSKLYNLKYFEGILLGIGGSIPELSTNLMATMKGNVELGIGAISGSGAMVLIFCFGLAGLVNKKNGKLNFFVYLRDVFIYFGVIILLKLFLNDKKIYFFQVCFMIMIFPIYVFIISCTKNLCKNKQENKEEKTEKEENLIEMKDIEQNPKLSKDINNKQNCPSSTYQFIIKIYSYFLPKSESYPTLSFIINLLAIIMHSNSLIILIEIISNLLKIEQSFLGMTLISWGDNIGDILNAYILSKKNSMETLSSSLIGSQIFNILICLNLPWFILLLKNKYFNGINVNFIEINFNNFNSLLISVFSSIIIIILFCMKLNKFNGIFLIVVYFCYLYYEFNLSKKNN